MTSEFTLIERFFARPAADAVLGVGDDAALLAVTPGMELAVSTDMLVAGTHFFTDTDARKLGWKTLAVNLSDLAAMGARPRWATLSIALPEIDEPWLAAFSDGFFKCAAQYGVALIGGDTTRGPLTLSVTILGEVPVGQALRRDGAKPGDDIWVSGHLGAAALALAALQGKVALDEASLNHCRRALETPLPRVEPGLALRGIAHAAIDISDGLLADLGHILERSGLGAEIHFDAIPCAAALQPLVDSGPGRNYLLAGGDDYELCFTAPPSRQDAITAIGERLGVAFTRIGSIAPGTGLRASSSRRRPMPAVRTGYDHFA
ncbi:MAG: thiamine-phosphate kinase [Methylobacterium sp.]|nr:thiamine-phosphate kinase [Methylobacterium sp.]